MMKLSILASFFMILTSSTSCQTTIDAGDYLNRPDYSQCITAFEKGYMFCNGIKKEIPPKMQVAGSSKDAELLIDYCSENEFKRYNCLRFGICE